MAFNDIMPWQGPHGGDVRRQHFRLNAAETFLRGEPVAINADGELTESNDDPVEADLLGIAAAPGDNTTNDDTPSATVVQTSMTYPTTANDGFPDTGDLIPVYMPDHTNYFITSNFGSTSEGFAETPALADIGDEAGLELVAGVWGINTGASNNTCRIIDVLDVNKNSIQQSAQPGLFVVFIIVAHQATHVTAPVA